MLVTGRSRGDKSEVWGLEMGCGSVFGASSNYSAHDREAQVTRNWFQNQRKWQRVEEESINSSSALPS